MVSWQRGAQISWKESRALRWFNLWLCNSLQVVFLVRYAGYCSAADSRILCRIQKWFRRTD